MKLYLLGFQDPATPIMEGIIDLHNYIFFYLVLVLFFVTSIFVNIFYYFNYKVVHDVSHRYLLLQGLKVTHGTILEIIWTLTPALILMCIGIPSFALLYSIDEVVAPGLIVRVIGHQWYWSYEYSSYNDADVTPPAFDSYMINEADLSTGQLRLLETDNPVVLPIQQHIRMLITSTDVLHSWALPSFGVKTDAVPGRLSQASIFIKRSGSYYGQCSEICGVNHGFMPININALVRNDFTFWYNGFNK